jgi:hypothetical protein
MKMPRKMRDKPLGPMPTGGGTGRVTSPNQGCGGKGSPIEADRSQLRTKIELGLDRFERDFDALIHGATDNGKGKAMTRACSICYFSHAYQKEGDLIQIYELAWNKGGKTTQKEATEDRFECRRYAPRASGRVYVEADGWCGEFEQKRHD